MIIILRKSANKCVYILFILFIYLFIIILFFRERTGLRMMCSRRLGILLKEESFIFLDLVHQRKKTTMLFVRLERLTVFYMYEPLLSLVQLKGKRVSPISKKHCTIAVCFYNECTVISDKIGFIVSLILISVAHYT